MPPSTVHIQPYWLNITIQLQHESSRGRNHSLKGLHCDCYSLFSAEDAKSREERPYGGYGFGHSGISALGQKQTHVQQRTQQADKLIAERRARLRY